MKDVKSDEIKPEFGLFPRSALNIFKTISGNLAAKKQVMTFSLFECSLLVNYDMLKNNREVKFNFVTNELTGITEKVIESTKDIFDFCYIIETKRATRSTS